MINYETIINLIGCTKTRTGLKVKAVLDTNEYETGIKVSDEQLFYLQSRGLTETEAKTMIVNGFFEAFTKELPMEYAVELNRLLALQMEGSIG